MKTKKAKDIMTTNVKVAKETDTISDIANTLISEKIGGLPVVDENNKVYISQGIKDHFSSDSDFTVIKK